MSQKIQNKVRVGFIGSGRRMQQMYLPAMKALADDCEVVGFTQRNQETGKIRERELNIKYFKNILDLVTAKIDVAIICTPPKSIVSVCNELVDLKTNFLSETPFTLALSEGRALIKRIKKQDILAGVVEQKPFLPEEQIKKQIIESGVLGKIVAVENDYCAYDYHAIAQLRNYLPKDDMPIKAYGMTQVSTGYYDDNKIDKEVWQFGLVSFVSSAVLTYKFSSLYKTLKTRFANNLKVYGERGSIIGKDISLVLNNNVVTKQIKNNSIIIDNKIFEYKNEYKQFNLNNDQLAILEHVRAAANAIRGDGNVLYHAEQGLLDVEIFNAIRSSGDMGGVEVKFPYNTTILKFRKFLSISYFKINSKKVFIVFKQKVKRFV